MLNSLTPQPADKILMLSGLYKADTRANKLDLGVGVYKNAEGLTPVMGAVKKAEHKLWEEQDTKTYVALAGDPAFGAAMQDLVLGGAVSGDRVSAAATPGGTGAIRQGLELIIHANPEATVWLSNPTWANHPSIINYLGMKSGTYRYFDPATRAVDFGGMLEDLEKVQRGDVVLLHGCCHNPTGANLKPSEFQAVIDVINRVGAIPFVDIAYQGFGDGLEDDGALTRLVAASCPEVLIAASCSKNFGIYRERTGIIMTVSETAEHAKVAQGTLNFLNRQNFSFPPDHGARLVTMILNDADLKADWMAELESVRLGMLDIRKDLAAALQTATGSDQFGFLADHRGMFSRLGLSEDIVLKLREDHAIYMVGDSRINIAGLNASTIPQLADAIAKTI